MTFLKKNFGNVVLVALLVLVVAKQVPLWLHSNEQIGKVFFEINTLKVNGESLRLPETNNKTVYIFWATWCGPCHVQLAQFEKAVVGGDLKPEQVVAVSLDKSSKDLKKFLADKKYSFKVVQAEENQSWTDLNVQATPSIAFVDENRKIFDFFTGLSPMSVFKATKFLN